MPGDADASANHGKRPERGIVRPLHRSRLEGRARNPLHVLEHDRLRRRCVHPQPELHRYAFPVLENNVFAGLRHRLRDNAPSFGVTERKIGIGYLVSLTPSSDIGLAKRHLARIYFDGGFRRRSRGVF